MSSVSAKSSESTSGARRSFFAATHLFGQYILLNMISLPVMAFIVRQLGKGGYGQWDAAATLAAVAMLFTNLGLRGAFVRAIARDPDSAAQLLAEQFGIRLPLCFFASAVVMVSCYALNYSWDITACAWVYCIWIFLNTIMSTLSDLLQGLQRMSVFAFVSLISGFTLTAISAIVAWQWPTPLGQALAYLTGTITTNILLMIYISRELFPVRIKWKSGRLKQIWAESKFIAVQQVINTVGAQVEKLVLPKAWGAPVNGLYAGGLLLTSRLWMIPDSLSTTFYPLIAQAHARDPRSGAEEAERSMLLSVLVCLPVAVVLAYFAQPVARILMPKDMEMCRLVILITTWALPLWAVESIMGYALNAAHRDAVNARFAGYSVIVAIVLGLALILKFGIVGACWSYVLRVALRIGFVGPVFWRTFSPRHLLGRLIRLGVCGGIMAGAIWLVRRAIPGLGALESQASGFHQWWMLTLACFAEGAVGTVVYGVAIFALKVYSPRAVLQVLRRGSANSEALVAHQASETAEAANATPAAGNPVS